MVTYSFQTSSAREDNALAFVAKKEGQTTQQYLDARWRSLVDQAVDQFVAQRSQMLSDAYLAAVPSVRQQINDLLGL